MTVTISIKKNSDIQRYDIRVGYEWATICITEGGLFLVESSYGVYGHWWSHHGRETFKHFLVELDRDHDYVMGKLGRRTCFYADKTVVEIKRQVLEERRNQNFTKEQAREAFDIEDLIDYGTSQDLFVQAIYDHEQLKDMYQDYDALPIRLEFDISLQMFMKEIFTAFVTSIRQELNEVRA